VTPRKAAQALVAALAILGIFALPASAAAPVVTVEDAKNVEYTTAKVEGTVNPEGQATIWRFQYATAADFSDAQDGPSGSTETAEPVSGALSGLKPNTTYHLRLLAENADGQDEAVAASTFTTKDVAKPAIGNLEVSGVTTDAAHFSSEVTAGGTDPGFKTSCFFDYVDDAAFNGAVNERQPLTITAEGGTYTLEYQDQFNNYNPAMTAPIPYNASASGPGSVEEALEALPNVHPGSFNVTGGPGDKDGSTPYLVEFTGDLSETDILGGLWIYQEGLIPPNGATGLSGDPDGVPGKFGSHYTKHVECDPSSLSGTTPTSVSADVDSLQPNSVYHVRVRAENQGGTSEAITTFKTGGSTPLVHAFAAGPVQADQVTLNGEVNPRNSPTTYWFEWGTQDCSANPCQKLPAGNLDEGRDYKWVDAPLTGLEPETTYHFRLVAENAFETTEGSDEEFTTAAVEAPCTNLGQLGTNFLPDCRAWEMVSPPDKNGTGISIMNSKTHVATDGNSITFTALASFGKVSGSGSDSEFLARRTALPGTNGWATHGIYPLVRPTPFRSINNNSTSYVNAFTPDLESAVFQTWRPLTGASNVENVSNYYRVSGLLDGGLDSIELLTNANAPVAYKPTPFGGPPGQLVDSIHPWLVAASTDLGHVVFTEKLPLTADAPTGSFGAFCTELGFACPTSLYDSTGAQVRLVGRVPAAGETFCDDANGPACEAASESQSAMGPGLTDSERTVSRDGRRIYFEANGHIYLREDGERTYEVAQSATVWDVSRDGSRIFFTNDEELDPADQDGSGVDAYMWDREAPAGERFTDLSLGVAGYESCGMQGIIGTNDAGDYTYFGCRGELLPGHTQNATGIYLWHDGELGYVGQLPNSGYIESNNSRRTIWNLEDLQRLSRISPDGRHLLFAGEDGDDVPEESGLRGSGGYAGSGAAGRGMQLYLYNADTGRIACVSCNPYGEAPKDFPHLRRNQASGTFGGSQHTPHALSDDGRYAFFSSVDALVEEDTNGTYDAYEYDAVTGKISLISTGTSSSPSYLMEATDDGSEVFFLTTQRLSGWDQDGLYDLYVAKVGGGLPEPRPVTAPCEGEACLPNAAPAPPSAATGSQAAGPGNPPQKCARGTRKVKHHGTIRCVKKHRHHKHGRKHRRAADTDRRAGK
jgi:hypothetical protein